MKRSTLLTLAALLLTPPAIAIAQDGPRKPPKTLEEARERAQKRLDRLNSMTEEEWQERRESRAERRKNWENLSPEERAERKKKMMERRKQAEEDAAGAGE